MVTNIDPDMFLSVIPTRSLITFAMEESSLQRDVEAAAESVGITAERHPIPAQNVFICSDQYNVVRAGSPGVMLLVGAGGDREIWRTWERWMATLYHRPGDDAQQQVNMEVGGTVPARVAGAGAPRDRCRASAKMQSRECVQAIKDNN